ncbi:family 43 glycosylhydrolase [Allosphingosinicella deserti]|uniref:Arabinofuranosidase n=1 Tax=Allosphingosinicella deserti TaxID=2116704 RepID=A0A2P7QRU7_9SPHN|nr:family 43 glycosylhydrolase [Sphingomonas deserti]PSJ40679.1 arabinofuranosidase [Sphingomonas deserti]
MVPSLLNRRSFVAGAAAAMFAAHATARAGQPAGSAAGVVAPRNPLVPQRADARIFKHNDGLYYMTASVPEYDRLAIRRAPTLAGLAAAEETVVWRRPASGKLGGYIWAPELHDIDGRWYIYFAAGNSDDPFHIRTYVLRNGGRDALAGPWELMGQFETPWDTFTLDSTLYVHRGRRYACWAQKEPGIDTNSNLYLAPLATPTTLAAPPTRLTVPTLPWEIQGFKVAEGPALIEHRGKLFLTYSASATDARYCLGLLTADAEADIMRADSWTKSPEPVFVTSDVTKVYGPGHNSFTVDEQGRDLLVYHGRDYESIEGDPLFDPNRHTRVQRLYFRPDGTPDFGIPVGNGEVPDRFAPADARTRFVRHHGARLIVGDGPLPSSQFRQKPGLAGTGTVSLEAVDAPGRFVQAQPGGAIVLAANDGSPAFARQVSFERRPGLSDPSGVSFALPGSGGRHLRHAAGGALRAGPVTNQADRASATFLVS